MVSQRDVQGFCIVAGNNKKWVSLLWVVWYTDVKYENGRVRPSKNEN